MIEHEEYCVSIRESYRMPDCTLVGYTVTLWRWNHLDETWWFAGRTRMPVRGLQRQPQEDVTAGETGREKTRRNLRLHQP